MLGCCVAHQPLLRVTEIGYHLVNVQGKKTYTTGQKLMAQDLKDRRMMRTGILPAVPEHLTSKHPTESLHPSFRGRPVAFPLAKQRNMATSHLQDSKLSLAKLAHARH